MLGRGSRVAGWLHSAPRLLRSPCAAALFSTPEQCQRIGTAATPAPPQGSVVFRPDAVKDQRRYVATAGAGRLNLLERKLAEKLQPMKIDDVDPEVKTALEEKYSPILGYPPNALLALARSRPVFHGAHALLSLTALGLARPEQSSSTSTGDSVSVVGTDTATAQQSEDPEVDPGLSERQVMACTYMAATLTESPYLKSQVEQMLSKVMEREQLDKMGMNCRLFWKEIEEFKESAVISEHEKLLLELCVSLFEGEVEPKVANRCVEELTEKVQAQVVHIGATMSFFATVSAVLGLKPEVLFRGKSGAVDFDSQGAVDGKLAEAVQLGWRATFEPLSKAGQRAIDFHKTTDSAVAKKVRGGSKTSAESAASYQQRLNPAHQIRLAFGFVPNCLLSMYPTPELLYAGIRLFKCIFSEASTLPETLKLTVAVECARGLDNDYLVCPSPLSSFVFLLLTLGNASVLRFSPLLGEHALVHGAQLRCPDEPG